MNKFPFLQQIRILLVKARKYFLFSLGGEKVNSNEVTEDEGERKRPINPCGGAYFIAYSVPSSEGTYTTPLA